jgi:hypothetical protein
VFGVVSVEDALRDAAELGVSSLAWLRGAATDAHAEGKVGPEVEHVVRNLCREAGVEYREPPVHAIDCDLDEDCTCGAAERDEPRRGARED